MMLCLCARTGSDGEGAPSIATTEGKASISLREHSIGPLDSAFERKFSAYDSNGG